MADTAPEPDLPELPPAVEQRIDEILLGPVEAIDAAFAELCSAHEPLRAALQRLRRDYARGAELLRGADATVPLPATVGPYRVLRQVGAGAFGVVFLAEQREPIHREVALKLLHATAFSPSARARFLNERETLARMNHPAIARIFDAGVDEQGRPFFVMEYVPGEPLHRFVAARRDSLPRCIELFLAACEGVSHAHQRGVIHRDLKPHNILVAEQDGRWLPKVIDFGLAKAIEAEQASPVTTQVGAVLGTPAYMSPEQLRGDAHTADTRTDVWALGVILHELLTGSLPFVAQGTGTEGLLDLQRRIRDVDPPLASAMAEQQGLPWARHLRGDLDWILRKAMQKSPAERYATVAELATDLRRFLRHEPVIAGPPSTMYLVRKFVRRHRGAMFAGGLVLASLLVGLFVSLALYRRADENAARAQRNLADFWLLADVVELEQLVAEADRMWPSMPDKLGDHDAWLVRAHALVQRRPVHAEAVRALQQQVAAVLPRDAVDAARGAVFLLRQLQKHLEQLDAFAADGGLQAQITGRAEFARTVVARTVDTQREQWDRTIAHVAGLPCYHGLVLRPIVGLVPLGSDPTSGFAEFALLQSGRVPARDADGKLEIATDTALVLVLVPGGEYPVGSQSTAPDQPAYDPWRSGVEIEASIARVGPFLLGKYELTQGQVVALGMPLRASGRMGTAEVVGPPFDARHPEESVLSAELQAQLQHYALRLPEQVEWEVAARAGSTSIWGCGDRAADLQDHANVADATLADMAPPGVAATRDLRDGFLLHAPVGSFLPNAFGFHDMIGNVSELVVARGQDGTTLTLARGGSYMLVPNECRIGSTRCITPGHTTPELGLRVARDLPPN